MEETDRVSGKDEWELRDVFGIRAMESLKQEVRGCFFLRGFNRGAPSLFGSKPSRLNFPRLSDGEVLRSGLVLRHHCQ